MAWRCFMAESDEARKNIGAMWWADDGWTEVAWRFPSGKVLMVRIPSRQYKDGNAPGGVWCPCHKPDFGGQWQLVSGEPPKITIRPSIGFPGRYHGWLTDGILSDDVEGRKYPWHPNTA